MALQVFLTGVGCVGKTTIGAELAALLRVHFHDLDRAVEEFFHKPLGRLQNEFLTSHSYRRVAVEALMDLLRRTRNQDWVIALPPSGLMYPFGREVRKSKGWVVVLQDDPENILERITFYDDNSNLIKKRLSEHQKRLHLREIKKDISYFKRSYLSAHMTMDISGLNVRESAVAVKEAVECAMEDGNGARPTAPESPASEDGPG